MCTADENVACLLCVCVLDSNSASLKLEFRMPQSNSIVCCIFVPKFVGVSKKITHKTSQLGPVIF
jgi:hypothetical protein